MRPFWGRSSDTKSAESSSGIAMLAAAIIRADGRRKASDEEGRSTRSARPLPIESTVQRPRLSLRQIRDRPRSCYGLSANCLRLHDRRGQ